MMDLADATLQKLLLLMHGLAIQAFRFVVGIEGVERGIAEVVEQISVQIVGAGLGDGVHYAAGSLAELRAVIAGADLEFLDGVEAIGVGDRGTAARFGEERLIVVGAIDHVVVVEAGDAAVGDEAAVRGHAGGEQHEVVPAAADDGQVLHKCLTDALRLFCFGGIDEFGLAGDFDGFSGAADAQSEIDGQRYADS